MASRSSFAPSAPSRILWLVALLIGGLGILFHFVQVAELSQYNYWMLLTGFVLLVVGTAYRNV
ncbi:MAG: hypothetical protein LH606_14425 [Cytophagaceae bacterium]|nr:hypothetical protein [Cytophagaceae bacterium]